jgi:glucosamine kinase
MQAVNHVQHVLDGRRPSSEFARAVIAAVGGDINGLFSWLATANQTTYAQLAPIVIGFAQQDARCDDIARAMMVKAGAEIAEVAQALDPDNTMPIALCGGLAAPMTAFLPQQLRVRVVPPQADAATGALQLIRQSLQGKQHAHSA